MRVPSGVQRAVVLALRVGPPARAARAGRDAALRVRAVLVQWTRYLYNRYLHNVITPFLLRLGNPVDPNPLSPEWKET